MLSIATADIPIAISGHGARAIGAARISALTIAHDDLDAAIDALTRVSLYWAGGADDVIIARLKKRKLQIRDEIAGLIAQVSEQKAGAAHG